MPVISNLHIWTLVWWQMWAKPMAFWKRQQIDLKKKFSWKVLPQFQGILFRWSRLQEPSWDRAWLAQPNSYLYSPCLCVPEYRLSEATCGTTADKRGVPLSPAPVPFSFQETNSEPLSLLRSPWLASLYTYGHMRPLHGSGQSFAQSAF